ncbi:MAG: hypothetical protein I3273_02235 [Candidatus Moeniiplasma glomeromycotorum]|nr:hypothetical protein [Candidatus Moeniiplasma glomeromycotorum]MCE8167064.1 hypothetical protein [Candidatus Moeniiplasma glomeromycotorum]MCE8168924.1 hypothetical protein [Candidatus Moeniiplasma glomeromycotorum]
MDNQLFLNFQTNESFLGKTYFWEGSKYWCCFFYRSGFALLNYSFPHSVVPDDNSLLVNSIRNNPAGGEFFSIPFSDLKFQPEFLKKGSLIQNAFLVKNTNQVKKITEKELFPSQTINFRVLNQKRVEKPAPGTYQHELEVEPFSLGPEGLPEIRQVVFNFGYSQSLESEPDSLIKTKLYNNKLLVKTVGKTLTMKVSRWQIGDIENGSDNVLSFDSSDSFEVDKFLQENSIENGSDNKNPPTRQGNKGLMIIGLVILLTLLLIGVFLLARKRQK